MTFKEITDLIKLVKKNNLAEFKLKDGEFSLQIRTDKYGKVDDQVKNPVYQIPQMPIPQINPSSSAPSESLTANLPAEKAEAGPPEEDLSKLIEVRSPIVGTFYRSPSPDKPPYIKVGDTIGVGTVVCIVEAMKLFNEIESEVSGKVVKSMVEDASPVEYDQVLFLVDPS